MPLWEQAAFPVCQLSDTLETLDVSQRHQMCFTHWGWQGATNPVELASVCVKLTCSTPTNYSAHSLTLQSL